MNKNSSDWVPLDQRLVAFLPKDRPYTRLEAMFSCQLDLYNGTPFSIRGYAKLWQWSRKKVANFLDTTTGTKEPLGSHKRATWEPLVDLIILHLHNQKSHLGATKEPLGSRTIIDKRKSKSKRKEKDLFRTTEKNVVLEPTNGKLENFSDHKWSKDVLGILAKYPTLGLVAVENKKNVKFWDGHVDFMSDYFTTDEEMKRWFNQRMFDINLWQADHPQRASKTQEGLRKRISGWLSKEYQKLEVTKR